MSKWTKESIEFADQQENRTDSYIKFLSGLTGYWSNITANPRNSQIDYQYTDKNDKTGVLECKIRKCDYNKFDEMFIEVDKYIALTGSTLTHNKATYINFLNDSFTEFWIVDIKKTMDKTPALQRNVYIKNLNLPSENNYIADRYLIDKKLGRHFAYDKENNEYKEIN